MIHSSCEQCFHNKHCINCSICGKIMFIDSYDGEPIQICERCSGKYGEERERKNEI